jgi:Tfp pilus assembly protein PilE
MVQLIHVTLHKALKQAVMDGLIPRNVTEAVKPPQPEKKEIRPLSEAQTRALLGAAKEERLEALYVLAITTGMRQGELLALKWEDVNLEAGALQVRRTLSTATGGGFSFHYYAPAQKKNSRRHAKKSVTPRLAELDTPSRVPPRPAGYCHLEGHETRNRTSSYFGTYVVMVIIGNIPPKTVLAAIALPTYLSQQNEAKDTAAQAQLRIAATAQQLYYAKQNEYAGSADALEDYYGFRQGGQPVEVKTASATAYCMQAPGGNAPFRISESTGKPEQGACPSA